MNNDGHRAIRRGIAMAFALCVCGLSADAQIMREPDPPDVGIDQKLGEQINLNLTFVDETGEQVRLGDVFRGKPVVLALVYYDCPMLCGEIMQGMLTCFNELDFTLGGEYDAVVVSIDPTETAELAATKKSNVLAGYERGGGADGWRFLTTADKAQIEQLAQTVGFRYQYMPSIDEYAHGSAIVVVTPEGKVSRYYYGIAYPKQDVTFGLMDAAGGKIGTLADKVLLMCYLYDPNSGSYGLVIMRVLRLAGIATVLLVGGMVGAFLLMERRRGARQRQELAHS